MKTVLPSGPISAADPGRRRLLALLAGAACPAARGQAPAPGHDPFGPVRPPLALPRTRVVTHRGVATELADLLHGRITAMQLMFTGCSATCPIQGAIFAAAQRKLGGTLPAVQWLSISIDTLADDPPALRAWLQRHQAQDGWLAATPQGRDLDPLLDALRGRAGDADRHVTAAFIVDRRAQLVFRTVDLPAPDALADLLRQAAQLA